MRCVPYFLYRPSTIVNDIWTYTQKSKIVLAELSGKNPNVFYELGLAHALAKPAILLTESIDDVPFDLRALRILEYNKNDPQWGNTLQEKITNAIKEVIQSPLQSVLPAFLSVKSDLKPKAVSEQDKLMLEMRQDIDLIRNELSRTRTYFRPSEIQTIGDLGEKIDYFLKKGASPSTVIRLLNRQTTWPLDVITKMVDASTNTNISQLEIFKSSESEPE